VEALTIIELSRFKPLRSWKDAPEGAIVQLAPGADGQPWLALKCHHARDPDDPGDIDHGLLRLDGADKGLRATPSDCPAVNVTDEFIVCVEAPVVRRFQTTAEMLQLYMHSNGAAFVYSEMARQGAYVCVKKQDSGRECIVGRIYLQLDQIQTLEIGRFGLALKG
jgi:hypothetical protein